MVHKNHPGAPIHPGSVVSGQMSVSAVTLCVMESELPSTLRYLAGNQCGVISRAQGLQAGLTTDMIKFRLRSGRWRLMHRGVYATFTGIPGRGARLWAAVLSAGPGAMLSYQTAAELHGLVDKTTNPIHVTVPHAREAVAAVRLAAGQVAAVRDRRRGGLGASPPWLARPAPAVLAWLPGPAGPSRIAPGRNRWTVSAVAPRRAGCGYRARLASLSGREPVTAATSRAVSVRSGRTTCAPAAARSAAG